MATPAAARRGTHRVGDARQHVDRCAFLDHEGRREVKRHRTGAGQIVDRAVNCERPDVAAGEEQGRHDEGIGAQGESATDRSRNDRGICQLVEQGVGEGGQKHRFE